MAAPTCRLFDLVAGTSTGGIIALAGRPRRGDAHTSVLVTSYDTAVANPHFFKRTTSAAPTYLLPYRLKPNVEGAADRSLSMGGVFANSPALDRSRSRAQAHDRQDDGVAAMALRPGP